MKLIEEYARKERKPRKTWKRKNVDWSSFKEKVEEGREIIGYTKED